MKSYEGTRVCEISGGPMICDVPGFALQSEGFTESKLILLTAQQADELREELSGQRIVTLFVKPADQEGGD